MKKVLLGVLAAAAVLLVGTISVFAVGSRTGQNGAIADRYSAYDMTGVEHGRHFADADGGGVCDYSGDVCSYVDRNNDGLCDNCGIYHGDCIAGNGACGGVYGTAGTGHGRHFTDADGDGICDSYTAGHGHAGGRGNGCHGRRGR